MTKRSINNNSIINEVIIPIPYTLPEDYFNETTAKILTEIPRNETVVFSKVLPFELPKGYFNEFSNGFINSIKKDISFEKIDAEVEDFPLLSAISKKEPYQIPENYFVEFSISQKPETKARNTKVFSLFSSRVFTRIAVAAIFLLVAGSTYLWYQSNTFNPENGYSSSKNIDINRKITTISDDELTKYLSTEYSINANELEITEDDDNIENPDINQKVKTIPDQDLNEYLQEVATKQPKTDI